MKSHWAGFSAWIISSDFDALKRVGLKHSSRETMYNGPLECRWVGFELYEGSQEKKGTLAEELPAVTDGLSPEVITEEDSSVVTNETLPDTASDAAESSKS